MQPTTHFRQASVSKTIVGLAHPPADPDRHLTLKTKVQDVLKLTHPDGSAGRARASHDVTIQHLLEHRSGLPTNPYGVEPNVVAAFRAGSHALPVTGRQTDRYMVTLPASPPPQPPAYNNWGYFLLGHVLMAKTGTSTLPGRAAPAPAEEPRDHRDPHRRTPASRASPRTRRATTRPCFATGPSIVEPDRRLRVTGYGGYWNLERNDGGGGLSASVVDVARLLAMLDVRTANPVLKPAAIANLFTLAAAGGGHGFDYAQIDDAANGELLRAEGRRHPGEQPELRPLPDGRLLDGRLLEPQRHRRGLRRRRLVVPRLPSAARAARSTTWGGGDLFPGFGMPSF